MPVGRDGFNGCIAPRQDSHHWEKTKLSPAVELPIILIRRYSAVLLWQRTALFALLLVGLLLGCTRAGSNTAEENQRGGSVAAKRPSRDDEGIPGFLAETSDGRASVLAAPKIHSGLSNVVIDYAVAITDSWVVSRQLNAPSTVTLERADGGDAAALGETRHTIFAPTSDVAACNSVGIVLTPANGDALFVGQGKGLLSRLDKTGQYTGFSLAIGLGGTVTMALVCLGAEDAAPSSYNERIAPENPANVQVTRDGASATISWTASATPGVNYAIAVRPSYLPNNCAEWYAEPSAIVGNVTSYDVELPDADGTYGVLVCAVKAGAPQSAGAGEIVFGAADSALLPRAFPDGQGADGWFDMTDAVRVFHLDESNKADFQPLLDARDTSLNSSAQYAGTNGASSASGLLGTAFLSTGAAQFIRMSEGPHDPQRGTWMGWFRGTDNDTRDQHILGGSQSPGSQSNDALLSHGFDPAGLRYLEPQGTITLGTTLACTLPEDEWVMITVTWAAGLRAIYMNDVRCDLDAGAPELTDIQEWFIGIAPGNLQYADPPSFKGLIDEVSLWGRALTDSEVKFIYENQRPRP